MQDFDKKKDEVYLKTVNEIINYEPIDEEESEEEEP